MTDSPALAVAERLLEPTTIGTVSDADTASLSHGLAGTALLHARLSAVDPTFDAAAIRHWAQAATHLRRHPTGFTGIHSGQGGLAASLIVGSAYLPAHHHIRATAARSATWLSARAVEIADRYRARATTTGPQWHTYDAITGLAGIGRVLLAASHNGYAGIEHGLTAALETLTAILGRSLTLAGHALGDLHLLKAANLAQTSLAARPAEQWDVEGPTLCHGHAGVLQAAHGGPAAGPATNAVTASFDRTHRFGFQHHTDNTTADNPGFLTGAAGIALALADHTHLPARTVPTSWDALLLLS